MDPVVANEASSTSLEKSFQADKTFPGGVYNEDNSSTLYDSALDNLTNISTMDSMNESLQNDSRNLEEGKLLNHMSTLKSDKSYSGVLNGGRNNVNDVISMNEKFEHVGDAKHNKNLLQNTPGNASALLIQYESTESNRSSSIEEVDPKSLLANKTIFKSDNPNLSIVEINDNSIKEEDLTNSVFVIEKPLDPDIQSHLNQKQKQPSSIINITNVPSQLESNHDGTMSMKDMEPSRTNIPCNLKDLKSTIADRSKRAKTLVHASKQKLDIDVAEAFAATEKKSVGADGSSQPEITQYIPSSINYPATKRDIKVYDTLDEFEQNLPSTVTVLDTPFGSRVYLVGTAHFSEESQDDVSYVIRNVRPDVIMIELCESRLHILKLDEKTLLEEAKSINFQKIREIVQANGYINGIFFILMLQMNAQIAKDLGMAPGGEFRRAFEEFHSIPGCILQLGDRPIRITLHKALKSLSLWQTCKLLLRLTTNDTISIEEVEKCKNKDLLEKLMEEMAGEFPAFADVFVKERDIYLCHSLQVAALPQQSSGSSIKRPVRVVGVVGIGHTKGIAERWGKLDLDDYPEIMVIPPDSLSVRIAKYTIKYGLIGLTMYGAYKIFRPRLGRYF